MTATAPTWHLASTSRLAVAVELEGLAHLTGDGRYRIAAGILRGRPAGRRPISGDDVLAVEVRWLVEHGHAKTIEEAARLVALTAPPGHSTAATGRRLARKTRAQK